MAMSNLPHPGRSIRENCLDPLGLNVTDAHSGEVERRIRGL